MFADRGCDKHARHEELARRGIGDGLMRRGNRHRAMPEAERARNARLADARMPAEGVFGYLKRVLGWRRARCAGMAGNEFEVLIKCTAWNLVRAGRLTRGTARA